MIIIKETKEQPDLFNPNKELNIIVETENTIDGHKTKMRVLPSHLSKYKDKIIRDELINTVTRMINGRYNNYKHSVRDTPQRKWEAAKVLVDKLNLITSFKNAYAVSKYIDKHLMHWLEVVTPGESSRFYFGYNQKLTALRTYAKQQILAHERSLEIVHFKEKTLRV